MTVETLQARMERRPLRIAEALDLAAQIAACLASAHARGVVHGHLEPDQVWIHPVERVEVVGLGPGDPRDARSDLRALGAILYEMLTGRTPAPPPSDAPLAPLPEGCPPAVSRILERALTADPAAVYPEIEAMRADLQAAEASLAEEGAAPTTLAGMSGLPLAVPVVLTGRKVSHFRVADRLGGGPPGRQTGEPLFNRRWDRQGPRFRDRQARG